MKPHLDGFAVVTAGTIASPELDACVDSWRMHARYQWPIYHVQGVYGSVPAFAKGVAEALDGGAQVIACLHNDLRIDEDGWDALVWDAFQQNSLVGLAGFGGAKGLGSDDIYKVPYQPQQLARQDFISNLQDAEAHGRRCTRVERVACLDGFSQIGRAEFFGPAWDWLDDEQKVVHHAYDSWLGVIAARYGWEVLFLPVACHHLGGRTAVGDQAYHAAVAEQGGDQGVWAHAHAAMYADCRGELPLRVS